MLKCQGGCRRIIDEFYLLKDGRIFCEDCWRKEREIFKKSQLEGQKLYSEELKRRSEINNQIKQIEEDIRIKTQNPEWYNFKKSEDFYLQKPHNYEEVQLLETKLNDLQKKNSRFLNPPFWEVYADYLKNPKWYSKKETKYFEEFEMPRIQKERKEKERKEKEERERKEILYLGSNLKRIEEESTIENPYDIFVLGLNYYDAQNYSVAIKWFTKAAEKGFAEAGFWLGYMYEAGVGINQHYKTAIACYLKAAESGYPDAQYKIGYMYANGIGIEKNNAQALTWFMKAAEQNYVISQYQMGYWYQNGNDEFDIKKDKTQAIYWYQKAAAQGNEDAIKQLKKLTRFKFFKK
jgi:hypothetical protein